MSRPQVPEPSGDIETVFGLWTFSSVDGSGACILALNRLPVRGGYGVHVERCALASMAAATHWRPTPGGFEIADAAGSVILEFRQTDVDAFVAVDGSLRVDRAPSA